MEEKEIIRSNVRTIREVTGLTQVEFGQILGATKAMIQSYENGKALPKRIILEKLAVLVDGTVVEISTEVIAYADIVLPDGLIDTLKLASELHENYSRLMDYQQVLDKLAFPNDQEELQRANILRENLEKEQSNLNIRLHRLRAVFGTESDIDTINRAGDFFDIVDFFRVRSKKLKHQNSVLNAQETLEPQLKSVVKQKNSGEIGIIRSDIAKFNNSVFPYFDSYDPQLLLDLVDKKLTEVMDFYNYQVMVFPGMGGGDFAVNLWNNVMEPRHEKGDIIICKYINEDREWSYVRFGQWYLAICDDGPMLARIERGSSEENFAFCWGSDLNMPPNKEGEYVRVIPKIRIKKLFHIKAGVTRLYS